LGGEKVGDSGDDMAAGFRAGAATVLLANEGNAALRGHEYTGVVVERLDELIGILEGGFEERVKGAEGGNVEEGNGGEGWEGAI